MATDALCSALLSSYSRKLESGGPGGHLALSITTWEKLLPLLQNWITCLHSQYMWNNNINTISPSGCYNTCNLHLLIASDFSGNRSQITFLVPPVSPFHLLHKKVVTSFLIKKRQAGFTPFIYFCLFLPLLYFLLNSEGRCIISFHRHLSNWEEIQWTNIYYACTIY